MRDEQQDRLPDGRGDIRRGSAVTGCQIDFDATGRATRQRPRHASTDQLRRHSGRVEKIGLGPKQFRRAVATEHTNRRDSRNGPKRKFDDAALRPTIQHKREILRRQGQAQSRLDMKPRRQDQTGYQGIVGAGLQTQMRFGLSNGHRFLRPGRFDRPVACVVLQLPASNGKGDGTAARGSDGPVRSAAGRSTGARDGHHRNVSRYPHLEPHALMRLQERNVLQEPPSGGPTDQALNFRSLMASKSLMPPPTRLVV